jgi:hypothetical protein
MFWQLLYCSFSQNLSGASRPRLVEKGEQYAELTEWKGRCKKNSFSSPQNDSTRRITSPRFPTSSPIPYPTLCLPFSLFKPMHSFLPVTLSPPLFRLKNSNNQTKPNIISPGEAIIFTRHSPVSSIGLRSFDEKMLICVLICSFLHEKDEKKGKIQHES